jgi:molecular chaperone DnaK (HSP70)
MSPPLHAPMSPSVAAPMSPPLHAPMSPSVAAPMSPPPPPPPAHAAHLGIDFGTSNTAAVLRTPDGRRLPLLFDGSPLLPSAVFSRPDGQIVVGRDALHLARTEPECFEPAPKRCIDDGHVLLGAREHAVTDLIAAVLARVLDEARRMLGGVTPPVTVTHPAAWGPARRETLIEAARRAGAPSADLLPEPVAAARFLTGLHGSTIGPGAAVAVYDFGAGTFDATVLVHREGRLDIAATEGLGDTGGRDIDAALLGHVAAVYAARDASTWRRLERPTEPADRRARWTLIDDVRTAKEMLSRTSSTLVHVPLFDDDLLLTREQLETLAAPIVDRTVAATKSALWAAGPAAARVGAVFLVGGSSRLPLATTVLHRAIAIAPTTLERPETVVAEGATTVRSQSGAW